MVVLSFPNCSPSHLFVFFFSARTTFSLFNSLFAILRCEFNCKGKYNTSQSRIKVVILRLFSNLMKITHYKLSLLFTRCTVLMPLPHSFATSRMEYPLRSKLITSLYSSFICSVVFTEPTLRPSFPPFSIYRFRPDCNRNNILSRSNCAQVESVDVIIRTKRDGFPSLSNNISCFFCM